MLLGVDETGKPLGSAPASITAGTTEYTTGKCDDDK